MANINSLFDIYCEDTKQRSEVEKSNGLKMTKKDFSFYLDRETERKQKPLNLLKAFQPSDKVL